jgi:O-antigen ligase
MNVSVKNQADMQTGGIVLIVLTILAGLISFQIGSLNFFTKHIFIPLFFCITILDFAIRTKNLDLFRAPRGNLHILFCFAFMWIILIAYARNPILPGFLSQGSSSLKGGISFYLNFLCSFLSYFVIIYWTNRNRKRAEQLFASLLYIALFITSLGIFMLVTGVQIPGFTSYAWSINTVEGIGADAGSLRIPFLGVYAQIGFVLALTGIGGSGNRRLAMLAYFALCIYLAGGRTIMITTFLGVIMWLYLNRKYMIASLSIFLIGASVLFMPLINELAPNPQLKRLTNIGSLEETSRTRHLMNTHLMEEILENPILGTGYHKDYELPLIKKGNKFLDPAIVEKQLVAGSHGAHLQLLKNLGILGYGLFIMMWLYPIYKLLPPAMWRSSEYPEEISQNAQTCLIMIGIFLIRMTTEGNGSSTIHYIFLAITTIVISHAVVHDGKRAKSPINSNQFNAITNSGFEATKS